jgi:hypothetical protein
VWNYDDPAEWARIRENGWETERAAAANRRLVREGATSHMLPSSLSRALRFIEHKFYDIADSLPARHPSGLDGDVLSDAEVVRLLALLAPDAEPVTARSLRETAPAADEEPCARCG